MLGDIAECPVCGDRALFLFAYGNYIDPLKEVIAHFKFKGITTPIPLLSELLVARFRDAIATCEADALVPIPLYPSREHERGYNQAEKFAVALSRQLDIPVDMQILIRTKKRREQARLSDREREANIKGVFEVIADAEPRETVILVDDVVTGGHTVAEARKILESAGFKVPAVIALAHGL
jgi:ComF family protein